MGGALGDSGQALGGLPSEAPAGLGISGGVDAPRWQQRRGAGESYFAPPGSYQYKGDMFDGGGPGRSGDKFEGGGIFSSLANALGIKPRPGRDGASYSTSGQMDAGGGFSDGSSGSAPDRRDPYREDEIQPAPYVDSRKIRDPLEYLAMTAQDRGDRMALGMASPAELMERARPTLPIVNDMPSAPGLGPRRSQPPMVSPTDPAFLGGLEGILNPPDPSRNFGPQQRFVDPYQADELSRMLEEMQLKGNPNSMWGF